VLKILPGRAVLLAVLKREQPTKSSMAILLICITCAHHLTGLTECHLLMDTLRITTKNITA
jgi:hypothetical protein